jgi:hypothetical protein
LGEEFSAAETIVKGQPETLRGMSAKLGQCLLSRELLFDTRTGHQKFRATAFREMQEKAATCWAATAYVAYEKIRYSRMFTGGRRL